eukprot:scaffold482_cov247-Pinguiococcus_pyrenoidosus.AAC.21
MKPSDRITASFFAAPCIRLLASGALTQDHQSQGRRWPADAGSSAPRTFSRVSKLAEMLSRTLFLAVAVAVAHADPMTFFAEDINDAGDGGVNEVPPLTEAPLADAARDEFLSFITDPDTEGFEAFEEDEETPLTIEFSCGDGQSVNATITGVGRVESQIKNGQYPISGLKYFRTRSESFEVEFTEPIAAFGFYGVDIGDVQGQLTITFITGSTLSGLSSIVTVDHVVDGNSGSVIYFGIIDTENPFQRLTFANSEGGRDVFAFDEFTIACPQQVQLSGPPSQAPSEVNLCAYGITDSSGTVCCCESCGACGGCDCDTLPGGAAECCPAAIITNGIPCLLSSDCGCVLDVDSPAVFLESGENECPE